MIITIPFSTVEVDFAQVVVDYGVAFNNTLFDQLADPAAEQSQIDEVNDYTRRRMSEDGFHRRILPPLAIVEDQLDRSVPTNPPGGRQ